MTYPSGLTRDFARKSFDIKVLNRSRRGPCQSVSKSMLMHGVVRHTANVIKLCKIHISGINWRGRKVLKSGEIIVLASLLLRRYLVEVCDSSEAVLSVVWQTYVEEA